MLDLGVNVTAEAGRVGADRVGDVLGEAGGAGGKAPMAVSGRPSGNERCAERTFRAALLAVPGLAAWLSRA